MMQNHQNTTIILGRCRAAIFDMDGVVTDTAEHHAKAWKKTFDKLQRILDARGIIMKPFHLEEDYNAYFAGRSRTEGIKAYLASRSISLPQGSEQHPEVDTMMGIAKFKNNLYRTYLQRFGADVYSDAISLIQNLKALSLKIGLATASKNAPMVLQQTGLSPLFDVIADGNDMAAYGLRSKPAPDIFIHVANQLGISFSQCAVFEDSHETLEQASRMSPLYAIGVERWDENTVNGRFGNFPVFNDLRCVSL